jgi:hypothetical protein
MDLKELPHHCHGGSCKLKGRPLCCCYQFRSSICSTGFLASIGGDIQHYKCHWGIKLDWGLALRTKGDIYHYYHGWKHLHSCVSTAHWHILETSPGQCSYSHLLTGVRLILGVSILLFLCWWRGRNKRPLYTTPEFSLTVTGAPIISPRKADGSFPSDSAPFSIIWLSFLSFTRGTGVGVGNTRLV